MPVYTFSTKDTKPEDTKAIEEIKALCEKNGLFFSSICVRTLKEWLECQKNTKA